MTNGKLKTDNIDNWSDEEVDERFRSSVWYSGLPCKPDESINRRLFVRQNRINRKAWKFAFDFLKKDLKSLSPGRYELSDDGTYAVISEYRTKEPDTAKYEVHRKYIDIQYVIEGEEYIEVIPVSQMKEKQDYDAQADILFFEDSVKGKLLHAGTAHFFVFFPEDAHKPCLKIVTVKQVKKVVVKIPFHGINNTLPLPSSINKDNAEK
ncbi:MAG: YhcH/YjgK/YiaL family protein [Tannerellaceae bacterium]|jgi:YhcH/YjgK/YiaL family protein|nr:YhcH/YjgK/YiaL family protein [Tannerellaceae bacterium]